MLKFLKNFVILIQYLPYLTSDFASNVHLSFKSIECQSSGITVEKYKCKKTNVLDHKVHGAIVEVHIKEPLNLVLIDLEIEQKLFTPFYMKLFKYTFEACGLLNLTEHDAVSRYIDMALSFIPTVPREYIHPCPYNGYNHFNISFNFHDLIAEYVNYIKGSYKLNINFHTKKDEQAFLVNVELEVVEV